MKHFEFLLFSSPNRINRGVYFGLLFEEALTYEEINSGTPRLAPFLKLNDKNSKTFQALLPNCESNSQWMEHFFNNSIKTYEKLKILGFTYYEGKVSVIEIEEEPHV